MAPRNPTLNRQQITVLAKDFLREYKGDPAADSPFAWDYLINLVADEMADKFKCLYGSSSGNLVANQTVYNAPTVASGPVVTEIAAITLYDSTGTMHAMQMRTRAYMDANHYGWRVCQAGACPRDAVTLGMNLFALFPAPDYSSNFDPTGTVPGGYTVEGAVLPGGSWDNPGAECPLPAQLHPVVVYQTCLYRIAQNPTDMNVKRGEMIQKMMQDKMDTFEGTMLRYTEATRVPSYTSGDNLSTNHAYPFNPLNQ